MAHSHVSFPPPPQIYRWMFELDGTDKTKRWPIEFVWGIDPVDSGDSLDPDDKGVVAFTSASEFDFAAPASQDFLLRFCLSARRQPFFERSSKRPDYVAMCAPELAAAAAAVPCGETTNDLTILGDGGRWRMPVANRLHDGWPLAFPQRDVCCGHSDNGTDGGASDGSFAFGDVLGTERVPSYWPLARAEFEQCMGMIAATAHSLPEQFGDWLNTPDPIYTGVLFDGADAMDGRATPRVRAFAITLTSSVTYSNA